MIRGLRVSVKGDNEIEEIGDNGKVVVVLWL